MRLWNKAEEALGGKIEILCNNAGVPPTVSSNFDYLSTLHKMSKLIQAGVEINLKIMAMGATIGAKYAIERMSRYLTVEKYYNFMLINL